MDTSLSWVLVWIFTLLVQNAPCKSTKSHNKDPNTIKIPRVQSLNAEDYKVFNHSIKGNVESFSGFLDGKSMSKMFFWFFISESKTSDPIIIWLQGDIGTSSLKGLFENNGPFSVKTRRGTKSRNYHWSQKNNVLYLDTVVGTGFSHTYERDEPNYPSNMGELVENIFVSINSFYNIFPYLKSNDIYLAGDGFACQIITKLALKMHRLKLKGLIIENGFCDPFNSVDVATFWLNLRMFPPIRQNVFGRMQQHIINLMKANKYEEAFDNYDSYIKGLLTPYKTLFSNVTFHESNHNILYESEEGRYLGNFSDYVTKDNMRHVLHVPKNLTYNNGKSVLRNLRGELMKSSMTDLGLVMDKYNVLMYYGQMNPEISPKSAYETGSTVKWCGTRFFGVEYKPWFLNNSLVGYTTTTKTGDCRSVFVWALVRNGGKDLAGEKSQEIFQLVDLFINNKF